MVDDDFLYVDKIVETPWKYYIRHLRLKGDVKDEITITTISR